MWLLCLRPCLWPLEQDELDSVEQNEHESDEDDEEELVQAPLHRELEDELEDDELDEELRECDEELEDEEEREWERECERPRHLGLHFLTFVTNDTEKPWCPTQASFSKGLFMLPTMLTSPRSEIMA